MAITKFTSKDYYEGVSAEPPEKGRNTTDVIFQEVRLYIEGVQVPFEAISITQSMGQLPSAELQIPPSAGLMDINRYYQPKVHIFYEDKNFGGFRLLFWGHIVRTGFMKSRMGSGSASITFSCLHKNALMNQITLDYSGYANDANQSATNNNAEEAVIKMNNFGSNQSIILALRGITGMQDDAADLIDPSNTEVDKADTSKLDKSFKEFEKRLVGMPAVVMNLWNQLKAAAYTTPQFNTILQTIYIPLAEQSIAYFKRLSGHFYLEDKLQASRDPYCPEKGTTAVDIMVPPAFKLPAMSAIQGTMAVQAITNTTGYSGELTSFMKLVEDFFSSIEYEVITLSSPAEVPLDPEADVAIDDPTQSYPKAAIETIVKPQIPFYYSPICNVLLPRMYHSIQISQEEDTIPTRLTAYSDLLPSQTDGMGQHYRAPHSIREAVAIGSVIKDSGSTEGTLSLSKTTGMSWNVPGKFEQGRGVIPTKIILPYWLTQMGKSRQQEGSNNQRVWPEEGTDEAKALVALSAAWIERNGFDVSEEDGLIYKKRNESKDTLNPFSKQSDLLPFQDLLISAADYEFSKAVVRSRSGTVTGVFNPYIVPGYPMDVLNDSPNQPSFHGLCTSVTHSISSRSISTTIGMAAASTYAEISNYYIPPLHAWLASTLKIVNAETDTDDEGNPKINTEADAKKVRSTLLQNDAAKEVADDFYASVFGVGAASPDLLYDFATCRVKPLARANGYLEEGTADRLPQQNGGEGNDNFTVVGNLRLISRPVESIESISEKFDYTFIDIRYDLYNEEAVQYAHPKLGKDFAFELGESLFLDYQETKKFISDAKLSHGTSQ